MREHPHLRAHCQPLRRGPGTVQLGTGPVLDGLTGGEVAVLGLLDGSRTRVQLYAVAAAHGEPPEVVDQLLVLLEGLQALEHPADARMHEWLRRRRRVMVSGSGAFTEALTAALRAADLAQVGHGSWAVDDLEHALRDAPGPDPVALPDLVVLTAVLALDPGLGDCWMRHGVTHIAVVDVGRQISIGPVVQPGRPEAGPCLRCVELHRCDRDPGRPVVLVQACAPGSALPRQARGGPWSGSGVDQAFTAAAAGLTALVVAAQLEGEGLGAGVSVELSWPGPRLDHRRWARHPRCPSHTPLDVLASSARETMAG